MLLQGMAWHGMDVVVTVYAYETFCVVGHGQEQRQEHNHDGLTRAELDLWVDAQE
jgi:hypothetical protein